MEFSFLS